MAEPTTNPTTTADPYAPLRPLTLAVIGAGAMGQAILSALIERAALPPDRLQVAEPVAALRDALAERWPIRLLERAADAVEGADLVLLAVKPQILPDVLAELHPSLRPQQTIVSIAAGLDLARLAGALPDGQPLVRAMPNTPAQIGQGLTALAYPDGLDTEHRARAEALFTSCGAVELVPETLMDAVVAVSGSSPAYVAIFIEAMADAAVALGMPREQALRMAARAVEGAAALIAETKVEPSVLKDRVSSPGGTTIAAVLELERLGLRHAVEAAMQAAARRNRELAGED